MTTAATVSVGPRYAPEDPTLPKPWRGLVDGKTGYLYYWNPETNVTQYERPTAAVSKPSPAPLSSSIQVHRSSEGQRYGYSPDRDDDRHRWASSGGPGYDDISRANQNVRAAATSSPNTVKGAVPVGYGTSSMGSSLSVDAYRRRHEITFHGDRVPPPMMSFDTTNFPSEILREMRYLLLERS